MWHDTAPLGLRTLLLEPGMFRTMLLSERNVCHKLSTIDDYAAASQEIKSALASENGTQAGDPDKLAEIVVDLVRGEGIAQGRELPLRMPLGVDAYDEIKKKCEDTLKLLEDWKDTIRSTDYAPETAK